MTPLEAALVERIKSQGPIGVADYMAACNAYYYATRDPLGTSGDFITAPEISQMFGEMVGMALAECWSRAGSPPGATYVELGPGRGTLAEDALRAMGAIGLKPDAILVETSPILRAAQAGRLPKARFVETLEEVGGEGPLLVVANEFFDALPVRQRVEGVERRVEWIGGALTFDRDGPIVEDSPDREAIAAQLGAMLARRGGAAILIDYGHDRPGAVGDTLQAVHAHRFAAVLERPGEQDLTAHVDFSALASAARGQGADVGGPISQGSWLETLGIAGRAMHLAARNPDQAEAIGAARRRLCDEAEMGTLFKVLGLAGKGWPMVAGL